MTNIVLPEPRLQIDFSYALGQIRTLYLQDALGATVSEISISELDSELSNFVPSQHLAALARHGLRGELIFPVPCLLIQNPMLLGYYRLLLGFSQKEFYGSQYGISPFKSMEVKGSFTKAHEDGIEELCKALVGSAVALIEGIGVDRLSKQLLDDLTLLTVGPQLRGGANVKKGAAGIVAVFQVIHDIVAHAAINSTASRIEIKNSSDRRVLVEFAPDPDIVKCSASI